MKIKYFLTITLLYCIGINAQVGKIGVNTTTPTRTLDIEGDLRIKTLSDKSNNPAYSTIMAHNTTTGMIDALPTSELVLVSQFKNEPWKIQGTTDPATDTSTAIYLNASVGIGDYSSTVASEKLEVKGSIKNEKSFVTNMGNVDNTNPTNYSNLAIDNSTGELVKVRTSGNTAPYAYVTFKVTTNVGNDYIYSFDTLIDTSQYTVLLVNAMFNVGKLELINNRVAPFNFSAFPENGTWRLTADYKDAGPETGKSYTWDLICLVIPNTQIRNLGTYNSSLVPYYVGELENPIPGL